MSPVPSFLALQCTYSLPLDLISEKSIWKNQVGNGLKIQFVELEFSKLIFQKSSPDQQGYAVSV